MAILSNETIQLGEFEDVKATGFQLEAGAYRFKVTQVEYSHKVVEKKDGTGTSDMYIASYKLTPVGSGDPQLPPECYLGRVVTFDLVGSTQQELVGKIATFIRDAKLTVESVGKPQNHVNELVDQEFNALYNYDSKGYGRINAPSLRRVN